MWVFNTLGILLICGSVIFLAYSTTRFLSVKAGKFMKGKNLSIVETLGLGLDKQLHLVKVGERYILLATCGKNVELLTELSPGEIGELEVQPAKEAEGFDFKETFEKYVGVLQKNFRQRAVRAEKTNKSSESDKISKHQNTNEKIKTVENLERIKAINRKFKNQSKFPGDDTFGEFTKENE